ncbi:MAG TPA: hypothetical protein VG502_13645 [Flexivirga sp.]|uniref:PseG/SpsG family protein n=1 Tax=Flexivirga sp. TaxID=1962927 RepID=UPI002CABBE79|nr:hypothetical protein [Flexivirga sp.]HWC23337.1 hypothetical protein [Flexivirga sp.]
MTFEETFHERIALRCDATAAIGVGHVVRCVALGQELRARGFDVVLWGRIDGIDWLSELVADSGLGRLPAADRVSEQVHEADAAGFAGVVLDGYHLPVPLGDALRDAGHVVLALVDGDFGAAQAADVYVDQNLGAEPHRGGPAGSQCLTGPEFTLLRDSVRMHRRTPGPTSATGEIRSVLAVFGGTDPAGVAPRVIPALLATGAELDVSVVASNPVVADRLAALHLSSRQRLRVIPPQRELAALAATSDLTISASGTTVWELLAIGVPTAVVCAVDNQRLGYRALLAADVATGLGELPDLDPMQVTSVLRELLENPQRATDLAARGQLLIDGEGRCRVADALAALLPDR